MSTRNDTLTPCQEQLTGIHVEQREADDGARLAALREAARVALADFDAGRFRTFSSIDHLRQHLHSRRADTSSHCEEEIRGGRGARAPCGVALVKR